MTRGIFVTNDVDMALLGQRLELLGERFKSGFRIVKQQAIFKAKDKVGNRYLRESSSSDNKNPPLTGI